jgi:hypothetical protein
MQIAKRVYSLAQEQNNSAMMIGACRALTVTLYHLGDFESARQYAIRGVEIWRSGDVQCPVEEVTAPAVACLFFEALSEWHFAEITSAKTTMAEAIALGRRAISAWKEIGRWSRRASRRLIVITQRITYAKIAALEEMAPSYVLQTLPLKTASSSVMKGPAATPSSGPQRLFRPRSCAAVSLIPPEGLQDGADSR